MSKYDEYNGVNLNNTWCFKIKLIDPTKKGRVRLFGYAEDPSEEDVFNTENNTKVTVIGEATHFKAKLLTLNPNIKFRGIKFKSTNACQFENEIQIKTTLENGVIKTYLWKPANHESPRNFNAKMVDDYKYFDYEFNGTSSMEFDIDKEVEVTLTMYVETRKETEIKEHTTILNDLLLEVKKLKQAVDNNSIRGKLKRLFTRKKNL